MTGAAAALLAVLAAVARAAPVDADCPAVPANFASAAFEKLTDSEDAKKADISDASRRARDRASGALYDRLAPSLPVVARKALRARIGSQELDSVPKGGNLYRVCVFAYVEAEYLDRLRLDDEAFRQQVEVLAAGVDRLRGDAGVAIDMPRNGDDCPVGPLGKALKARLQAVLANRAVRWTDTERPDVARLRLTVNPDDAAGVTLAAVLDVPGKGDEVAEGFGFTFNPAVLVEDPEQAVTTAQGTCTANKPAKLDRYGHREGETGVSVTLAADRELDHVAAGEEVEFRVAVSRAAQVQLFSIDPVSGVVYLVHPDGEFGGRLVNPGEPWRVRVVFDALPDPRPEQLLAVAVPTASRLDDSGAWRGFCRVPSGRSPLEFGPREAALHMVRFFVEPGATTPTNPPPGTVTECGGTRSYAYP